METSGPSSDSIWASSIAAILESAEDREEALRLLARMLPAMALGIVLVFWGWRPAPPVVATELPKPPQIRVFNLVIDEQPDHVLVSWETNLRTVGRVRYGNDERHLDEMVMDPEGGDETMHMVVVRGLAPGGEYWLRIDSRDPKGRAAPQLSEVTSFHTPEEIPRDPSQDLVPLVKSYIDKLTRMTPDERAKLHASISQFAAPRGDITEEIKKELRVTRTDPTHEERFQDRMRQARNWGVALEKAGRDVSTAEELVERAAKLLGSNPVRAAETLDRAIAMLIEAEACK